MTSVNELKKGDILTKTFRNKKMEHLIYCVWDADKGKNRSERIMNDDSHGEITPLCIHNSEIEGGYSIDKKSTLNKLRIAIGLVFLPDDGSDDNWHVFEDCNGALLKSQELTSNKQDFFNEQRDNAIEKIEELKARNESLIERLGSK